MKISRFSCVLGALVAASCGDSGTVMVDAEWNLTCPENSAVGCGSLAPKTCLGDIGNRVIVGSRGETSCTGDPIIVSCEALQRPDGRTVLFLETSISDDFAFELAGAAVDSGDGFTEGSSCVVRIVEDKADYGGRARGRCGIEPPSMEQPCQLSNISTRGGSVEFDLECKSLMSSTSGHGFDVGAVGGGPTTIRFSNCTGL